MFRSKVRSTPSSLLERRFRQRQRLGKRNFSSCSPQLIFLSIMIFLLTLEIVMLINTSMPKPMHNPQGVPRPKPRLRKFHYDISGEVDFPAQGEEDTLSDAPRLQELMDRLSTAIRPFQLKYLRSQAVKSGAPIPDCDVKWEIEENAFLGGCPRKGCLRFATLDEAKDVCIDTSDCSGVVFTGGKYELRSQEFTTKSLTGEVSYLQSGSCMQRSTPRGVWKAFSAAMDDALNDPSLHLDTEYGPPRDDNSIYMSIASYRDNTCPTTLRMAFERAKYPEKLFVGIVQQNCNEECMTGTGWADTRRWVPSSPDVDCVEEFCASETLAPYCSQIRILRLEEAQAFGPFFSRYLNSKLWRGETFYLQIDAHTEFRSGWDASLIKQMRATPTYPFSVISNYPPSGSPLDAKEWSDSDAYPRMPPSALCGCQFETAGGAHKTVRLRETRRVFFNDAVPRHSAFIAAGFFIAHGSIVDNVPFDPFMPFLFMGEEIALSIRMWTAGYDIYAPSKNVLRHEYVRKESPKFWESVGMVFSNGNLHNGLTDLIIPRVQRLLGFIDDDQGAQDDLFIRADDYSTGHERTVEEFTSFVGLDLDRYTQSAPKWCTQGLELDT